MNNNINIKDTDTFLNSINNIRTYSEEIVSSLEKSNTIFDKVTYEDVWKSKSSNELKEKNEELKKQLEVVNANFKNYVTFLDNTLNSYKMADLKIKNDSDKLSE